MPSKGRAMRILNCGTCLTSEQEALYEEKFRVAPTP